jgi:hypothetical protein
VIKRYKDHIRWEAAYQCAFGTHSGTSEVQHDAQTLPLILVQTGAACSILNTKYKAETLALRSLFSYSSLRHEKPRRFYNRSHLHDEFSAAVNFRHPFSTRVHSFSSATSQRPASAELSPTSAAQLPPSTIELKRQDRPVGRVLTLPCGKRNATAFIDSLFCGVFATTGKL